MTQPPTEKTTPKRRTRRNPRRLHSRGLSDEQHREVLLKQREAIEKIVDGLEQYFCADIDARIEKIEKIMEEPDEPEEEIDAEFIV